MANDVDIVIGAKNQASKILDDVGRSTQMLATNVASSAEKIKVSFAAIAAPLAAIGTAIAAFKGGGELISFLTSSAQAFGDSEEASRKLSLAIDLNGESSQSSMERHSALADTLQRTMNIEDEVTKGLMAQASMLGVADDKLDDTTKAAIGLATAMGTSLDDGLAKVRKALDGNFTSIERQIPAIKALKTEEGKFAAILSLSEKGLMQKAASSDMASQADERAMLAIGELMESVGAAVLPLQAMAYQGLEIVATSINTAFGPALKNAGTAIDRLNVRVLSGFKSVAIGVVTAGTILEVAWENLGNLAAIASASVILSLETMRADAQNALTVAIPAYVIWFGDNFSNLITDACAAVIKTFENMGKIVGEIFAAIWLVIAGEQTVGEAMENIGRAAGRGLLDGFKATTKELPDVLTRALTDTEKSMTSFLSTASNNIAGQLDSKLTERLKAVNDALAPKEEDDEAKKIGKNFRMNKAGEKKEKQDTESILTATESRLLTRGKVDNATEKVAQNTTRMIEQNDELKTELYQQTQRLDKIEQNTNIEVEMVPG